MENHHHHHSPTNPQIESAILPREDGDKMDEPNTNKATTTFITCDSCARNNTRCIGFPTCERCALHDLECLYSPAAQDISHLKETFSSLLLLPGQEPPPRLPPLVFDSVRPSSARGGASRESCVVCVHLGKVCGGQEPKCKECGDEGFLCIYEEKKGGGGVRSYSQHVEERRGGRKGKFVLAETVKRLDLERDAQQCDTCRVWEAYCDAEKPTCSSCLVRNVQCSYKSSKTLKSSRQVSTPKSPPRHFSPPRQNAGSTSNSPWVSANLSSYNRYSTSPTPSLSQMYSTPSGCISCFNSKSKCTPLSYPNSTRTCERCLSSGTECKQFAPGTRLIACDSCISSRVPCTNDKEGLRCDECVVRGRSCSRSGAEQELFVDPPLVDISEAHQNHSFSESDARTCNTCLELHQFCDGVEPACALCAEVGLTCVYQRTASPPPPAQSRSEVVVEPTDAASKRNKPGCDRCRRRGLSCDGSVSSHCTSCRLAKRNCRWKSAVIQATTTSSSSSSSCVTSPKNASDGHQPELKFPIAEVQAQELPPALTTTQTSTPNLVVHQSTPIKAIQVKPLIVKTPSTKPNNIAEKPPKLERQHDQSKITPRGDSTHLKSDDEESLEDVNLSEDEWEQITHTEALGPGKPGELGVIEMEE